MSKRLFNFCIAKHLINYKISTSQLPCYFWFQKHLDWWLYDVFCLVIFAKVCRNSYSHLRASFVDDFQNDAPLPIQKNENPSSFVFVLNEKKLNFQNETLSLNKFKPKILKHIYCNHETHSKPKRNDIHFSRGNYSFMDFDTRISENCPLVCLRSKNHQYNDKPLFLRCKYNIQNPKYTILLQKKGGAINGWLIFLWWLNG